MEEWSEVEQIQGRRRNRKKRARKKNVCCPCPPGTGTFLDPNSSILPLEASRERLPRSTEARGPERRSATQGRLPLRQRRGRRFFGFASERRIHRLQSVASSSSSRSPSTTTTTTRWMRTQQRASPAAAAGSSRRGALERTREKVDRERKNGIVIDQSL